MARLTYFMLVSFVVISIPVIDAFKFIRSVRSTCSTCSNSRGSSLRRKSQLVESSIDVSRQANIAKSSLRYQVELLFRIVVNVHRNPVKSPRYGSICV